MYQHPATQGHLATLRERGALVMEPGAGGWPPARRAWAACPEPPQILDALRVLLGRGGPLAGRRVVITAGGTQEPLDPVRYLGNRSSGQMGWALAEAALARGAAVTLIHGPVALAAALGRRRRARWGPPRELEAAVRAAVAGADCADHGRRPRRLPPRRRSASRRSRSSPARIP